MLKYPKEGDIAEPYQERSATNLKAREIAKNSKVTRSGSFKWKRAVLKNAEKQLSKTKKR